MYLILRLVDAHPGQEAVEPPLLEQQHCPSQADQHHNADGIRQERFQRRRPGGHAVHHARKERRNLPLVVVNEDHQVVDACNAARRALATDRSGGPVC